MLLQLKVNIRSFLKLLFTPLNPSEAPDLERDDDQVSKENEVFNNRIAPYSCNLSITTFNSILLLLNISVSETLSADIFRALQDLYIDPLTTQLFQSFLFEDKDHHRASDLHYIEMLCQVIRRSSNAETCDASHWQCYFEFHSRLGALVESIQRNDSNRSVTPENDQSFSSISSTSILSCKILSGSTTPSNSRSSSSGSASNEFSFASTPPNHRKSSLAMKRKLTQLDEAPGHRIKHIELPKIDEELKHQYEKKRSSNASYYDEVSESDESHCLNPRVRTPKIQVSGGLPGGLPKLKAPVKVDPGKQRCSSDMSDEYDSGDFNRELVDQRRRSMRGDVRVTRSHTTDDIGKIYEPLVYCDEEHLSLSRQNIQSVIGDPNDN